MKLVLFDCDGTLVDSAALIHEVMVRTFVFFGYEKPSLEATKSVIGLTLDIAIARILGHSHVDDQVSAMATYYRSIYSDVRHEPKMENALFDGIKHVIEVFSAREDILIGAVTGKSRRGLTQVLHDHAFTPYFTVSRTADDCPSKPHPAMVTECCLEMGMDADDTLVIGDAVYDMQMAKAAGAKAIGVSWGYASVTDLLAAGADDIVMHPHDILRII